MDKDLCLGVFTGAFGLLVLFVLVPLGVDLDEVDAGTQMLIRPDFWPMVVAGLMVLIGSIYAVVSYSKSRASRTQPAATEARSRSPADPRRFTAIIVVILLFAFTGEFTGMLIPAIALFIVSAFGFGNSLTLYKAVGAVLVPLVILQFFERIANIPIPLGVLQGILS